MDSIYKNGRYMLNNPTWHVEDSPWKAEYIIKMLTRVPLARSNSNGPLLLENKTSMTTPDNTYLNTIKTIYEIGCGAGEILNQLYFKLPDDIKYYGYEISPQAYQLCLERQKDRLSFYCEDLLENRPDCYDLLLLINVLEHLDDFTSLLKRVKERTRYKIIWVPLELSSQSVIRSSYLSSIERFGHLHFFTKDHFLAILNQLEYEIIDWFYVPTSIELDNRGFKAKMMKTPRKLLFTLNKDFTARLLGGFSLIVLAK